MQILVLNCGSSSIKYKLFLMPKAEVISKGMIDRIGFKDSVFDYTYKNIPQKNKKYIDLAPLHNPPNLKGILTIKKLLPKIPQVAIFDTAFHQTIPDYAYMYALPYSLYKKHKIRKYGFHGTSHQYVSKRGCQILKLNFEKQKIITCHLGNGASMAAIDQGKVIDTSMGMTPLEGLIMGTRPGDTDPGALIYLMQKEKLNAEKLNELLNKKS